MLVTLAQFITGEFDNREQAIATPAWFVHLRLWQRPTQLFAADSFTVFAEQANVLKLEQPYRQRFLRLQETDQGLTVQYYMPKDPSRVKGAGQNPGLLENLTEEEVDRLPGCFLEVRRQENDRFIASQPENCQCRFSFQGTTLQVALGFETTATHFWSYDKGTDPETNQPIWGAILGAYEFSKRQQF